MSTKYKFSEVQKIVRRAFPGAVSRRAVHIEARAQYRVSDYWDSGSRAEAVCISRKTGLILDLSQVGFEKQVQGNPFGAMMGTVKLTSEFIIVEHSIFCGKDYGYRLVVSPDSSDMAQFFSRTL